MAEQDSEKTEAPTPRRRQEARDNGQVARSNDLSAAVLLLASLLLLQLQSRPMAAALKAKGYPYRYVFAQAAGHTDYRVTAQTLPGALEWLWDGYEATTK